MTPTLVLASVWLYCWCQYNVMQFAKVPHQVPFGRSPVFFGPPFFSENICALRAMMVSWSGFGFIQVPFLTMPL
jgi:hypothetical protein